MRRHGRHVLCRSEHIAARLLGRIFMPNLAAKDISQAKLANLLKDVAEDMIAAEGEFQALDAALGDGDLGVTVKMGFQAIREVCQKSDQTQTSNIGSFLSAAG